MGWAAYRFTRSTGGSITVIAPQVNAVINLPKDWITTDDLLSYGFPFESTVFCPTELLNDAVAYGFGNAIDSFSYAGETWTLDNGSTIEFSTVTTLQGTEIKEQFIRFRVPGVAGSSAVSIRYAGRETQDSIAFPVCIVGDINTAKGCYANSPYIDNSSTLIKLKFTYGKFPASDLGTYIGNFYVGAEQIYDTEDPYDGGGESGGGGGTGDFDGTGDDIGIPSLPTLSATDAGFITLFNPTISEMANLASYLWSDLFDIETWKKVFADPMQAILGLSIVPVNVPAAGAKPVKVGNISTGVSMTYASTQYVEVDCGTLNVNEFWGAYLDYDPYTKAEIYLPYIGTHPLSTDDIMGKSVHVVYHVDILSGACCAYVQCGGSVLYSFVGQCTSSIPITGDNWTNVINGALSIAGAVGSMVASGGATAPMAITQIASTAVNSMKPTVEKSGSMGGTGGMLGVQTPYLILTRPRQCLPAGQNSFIGYPSFITEKLSNLTGYTEVDSIHLENVPATEQELSEIETLLKGGAIF